MLFKLRYIFAIQIGLAFLITTESCVGGRGNGRGKQTDGGDIRPTTPANNNKGTEDDDFKNATGDPFNIRLNITRGEHDTFENPYCRGRTDCNCSGLNARCTDDSCKQCVCNDNYKTFLPSRTNSTCVKNGSHFNFSELRDCYGFITLTNNSCTLSQGIDAPPTLKKEDTCIVVWDKLKILEYDKWENPNSSVFKNNITIFIENSKIRFKWNNEDTLYKWKGLIVKLLLNCTHSLNNYTCYLLKFSDSFGTSPSDCTRTETPRNTNPTTWSTGKGTKRNTVSSLTFSSTSSLYTPGTHSTSGSRDASMFTPTNKKKPLIGESSSSVVIIVVCVVIGLLVVCCIIGLIFYNRRRHTVKRSSDVAISNAAVGLSVKQSFDVSANPIYSPAENHLNPFPFETNCVYEEPAKTGASQDCVLYESADTPVNNAEVDENGKSEQTTYDSARNDKATYDYASNEKETYDYANNDGLCVAKRFLEDCGQSNDKEGDDSTHVYHMLEADQ